MFLKEALNMTDKVNGFNTAADTVKFKRGAAGIVNLVAAFQARGVTFGPMDGLPQGQFEK